MLSPRLSRRHIEGGVEGESQQSFNPHKSHQRVPETLQTVLVVSNRGKDVAAPPPGGVAFKMFGRRKSLNNQSSGLLKTWFGSNGENPGEAPVKRLSLRGSLRRSSSSTCETWQDGDSAASPPVETPRRRRSSRKSGNISKEDLPKEISALEPDTTHHVSPQTYFDSMVKTRGYSAKTFKSLETAYYNKPTPIQMASHGVLLTQAIRRNNLQELQRFMEAGLSPNACNEFGESILHMVCRLGHAECLKILLEHGCVVQVCDDYGRNPLHDACWSTNVNFECVDLLLEQDPRLLCLEDKRGSTPLSYLKQEQWTAWTKFLMSKKDKHWPERNMIKLGMQPDPELAQQEPNTRPIPDPKQNISLELARMVAYGKMTPMEAILMMDDDSDDEEVEDTSNSEDYDDFADYDGYESEISESYNEEELKVVLGSLCCLGKGKSLAWT